MVPLGDRYDGRGTKIIEELAVDISVNEKMRVYINNRVLAAQADRCII